MIEATGKIATGIVDGLKSTPMALSLILINVLFLGMVVYVLHEVSARVAARDTLITKLAQECKLEVPK